MKLWKIIQTFIFDQHNKGEKFLSPTWIKEGDIISSKTNGNLEVIKVQKNGMFTGRYKGIKSFSVVQNLIPGCYNKINN